MAGSIQVRVHSSVDKDINYLAPLIHNAANRVIEDNIDKLYGNVYVVSHTDFVDDLK